MRKLTLALDGLPALRDATRSRELDLTAAITLAELAGVDAIRLGITEVLRPVREEDRFALLSHPTGNTLTQWEADRCGLGVEIAGTCVGSSTCGANGQPTADTVQEHE